jgi:hypothetical protein
VTELEPRPSYYARVRASLHARAPRHAGKLAGAIAAVAAGAVIARLAGLELGDVLRWLTTLAR